jgi:hypothetical protein
MADSAVRLDVLEAADLRGNLAAEFSFDSECLDSLTQGVLLRGRQIVRSGAVRDLQFRKYFLGARAAHAVDGREADLETLVIRYSDSGDTHR